MHVCTNPTGRLVTFRITPPVSDENSGPAALDLRNTIVAVTGPVVVVSDLRAARTFSPETAQRFVALMRSDNPKIQRSALLMNAEMSTLGLQIARMVKEAGNDGRRVFFDPRELAGWLGELLNRDEQAALQTFLG